jgi:hypothetical protein
MPSNNIRRLKAGSDREQSSGSTRFKVGTVDRLGAKKYGAIGRCLGILNSFQVVTVSRGMPGQRREEREQRASVSETLRAVLGPMPGYMQ